MKGSASVLNNLTLASENGLDLHYIINNIMLHEYIRERNPSEETARSYISSKTSSLLYTPPIMHIKPPANPLYINHGSNRDDLNLPYIDPFAARHTTRYPESVINRTRYHV
jgi:hypothetical protein